MIVASGARGALPHGVATNKVIQAGDMVTMDFGALYEHYRSDITRTVAVGEPDERLKEIYSIVKEAQQVGRQNLKAGVRSCDLEQKIRGFIEQSGYSLIHGPDTALVWIFMKHPLSHEQIRKRFKRELLSHWSPESMYPVWAGYGSRMTS